MLETGITLGFCSIFLKTYSIIKKKYICFFVVVVFNFPTLFPLQGDSSPLMCFLLKNVLIQAMFELNVIGEDSVMSHYY